MPASKTSQNAQLDAIDMLVADHRRVSKLFKEFEKIKDKGDEEACIEVVESACAELKIHSMLELEIFYPAVRSKADEDLAEIMNEADVEHESVEILIDKLAELEPSDPMYAANFTVLAEYVDHHVKEEEKEMFPKVRKLKDLDLDELGDEMQARKDDLLGQLGEVEDETLIADEAEKETALKRGGSQESSRRPRAAK